MKPIEYLQEKIIAQPVVVKLNTGVIYKGKLASLDGYMNVAMENTEEISPEKPEPQFIGDAFIRGNNVLYIAPQ